MSWATSRRRTLPFWTGALPSWPPAESLTRSYADRTELSCFSDRPARLLQLEAGRFCERFVFRQFRSDEGAELRRRHIQQLAADFVKAPADRLVSAGIGERIADF